ncbi:hypothetical protein [uncultured Tenacibaculum sp.]|uniref:hypothetical protein n=1 Tax=uncultured Tenacibaculum sp. TaxID=174713 RepID=UPI0026261458|nr:hypothetical protein [uncultured Tenacibaculum sp.]
MKKIFLLLLIISVTTQANAQLFKSNKKKAQEDTEEFNYEITCFGVGVQGTSLIKVYSYSKKPQVAKMQAKKNAVHAIIFKGYAGVNGCQTQKPLARNTTLDKEKEGYFKDFFKDGGPYLKYVTISNDGANTEVKKVKKKLYKVGVLVSVNKDELRKRLEHDGVIKTLSSGF